MIANFFFAFCLVYSQFSWYKQGNGPLVDMPAHEGDFSFPPFVIATFVPGESSRSQVSYRCNFCHYATLTKDEISAHINGHIFRCSSCDYSTHMQHRLMDHKRDKHGRAHPLPYDLLCLGRQDKLENVSADFAKNKNVRFPGRAVPKVLKTYKRGRSRDSPPPRVFNERDYEYISSRIFFTITEQTVPSVVEAKATCTETQAVAHTLATRSSKRASILVGKLPVEPSLIGAIAVTPDCPQKPAVERLFYLNWCRSIRKRPTLYASSQSSCVELQSSQIVVNSKYKTSALKNLLSYLDSQELAHSHHAVLSCGAEPVATVKVIPQQLHICYSHPVLKSVQLSNLSRLRVKSVEFSSPAVDEHVAERHCSIQGQYIPLETAAEITSVTTSSPRSIIYDEDVGRMACIQTARPVENSLALLRAPVVAPCCKTTRDENRQCATREVIAPITIAVRAPLDVHVCDAEREILHFQNSCATTEVQEALISMLAICDVPVEKASVVKPQRQVKIWRETSPYDGQLLTSKEHAHPQTVNSDPESQIADLISSEQEENVETCPSESSMEDSGQDSRKRSLRKLPSRQCAAAREAERDALRRKGSSEELAKASSENSDVKSDRFTMAKGKMTDGRRSRKASGRSTIAPVEAVPVIGQSSNESLTSNRATDQEVDHYFFSDTNEQLEEDHWNTSLKSGRSRPSSELSSHRDSPKSTDNAIELHKSAETLAVTAPRAVVLPVLAKSSGDSVALAQKLTTTAKSAKAPKPPKPPSGKKVSPVFRADDMFVLSPEELRVPSAKSTDILELEPPVVIDVDDEPAKETGSTADSDVLKVRKGWRKKLNIPNLATSPKQALRRPPPLSLLYNQAKLGIQDKMKHLVTLSVQDDEETSPVEVQYAIRQTVGSKMDVVKDPMTTSDRLTSLARNQSAVKSRRSSSVSSRASGLADEWAATCSVSGRSRECHSTIRVIRFADASDDKTLSKPKPDEKPTNQLAHIPGDLPKSPSKAEFAPISPMIAKSASVTPLLVTPSNSGKGEHRSRKRKRSTVSDFPKRKPPVRETALIKHALNSLLQPPVHKRARHSSKVVEKSLSFNDLSDADQIPDCLLNIQTRHCTPSPVRQVPKFVKLSVMKMTEGSLSGIIEPVTIATAILNTESQPYQVSDQCWVSPFSTVSHHVVRIETSSSTRQSYKRIKARVKQPVSYCGTPTVYEPSMVATQLPPDSAIYNPGDTIGTANTGRPDDAPDMIVDEDYIRPCPNVSEFVPLETVSHDIPVSGRVNFFPRVVSVREPRLRHHEASTSPLCYHEANTSAEPYNATPLRIGSVHQEMVLPQNVSYLDNHAIADQPGSLVCQQETHQFCLTTDGFEEGTIVAFDPWLTPLRQFPPVAFSSPTIDFTHSPKLLVATEQPAPPVFVNEPPILSHSLTPVLSDDEAESYADHYSQSPVVIGTGTIEDHATVWDSSLYTSFTDLANGYTTITGKHTDDEGADFTRVADKSAVDRRPGAGPENLTTSVAHTADLPVISEGAGHQGSPDTQATASHMLPICASAVIVDAPSEVCATTVQTSFGPQHPSSSAYVTTSKPIGKAYSSLKSKLQLAYQKGALIKRPLLVVPPAAVVPEQAPKPAAVVAGQAPKPADPITKVAPLPADVQTKDPNISTPSTSTSRDKDAIVLPSTSSSESKKSRKRKSDSSGKSKKEKKSSKHKKHKKKHKESPSLDSTPKLPHSKPKLPSPGSAPSSLDMLNKSTPRRPSISKKPKRELVTLEDSLIFYPVPSDNGEQSCSTKHSSAADKSVATNKSIATNKAHVTLNGAQPDADSTSHNHKKVDSKSSVVTVSRKRKHSSSGHQQSEKKSKSSHTTDKLSLSHSTDKPESKHLTVEQNVRNSTDKQKSSKSKSKSRSKGKEAEEQPSETFSVIIMSPTREPAKLPWSDDTIMDVCRCNMCDFMSIEMSDLRDHKKAIHAVKSMMPKLAACEYDPPVNGDVHYKCTLCGLGDEKLKKIRVHITKEHGGKLKSCERVTHARSENGFSLLVESVRVYR